MKLIGIILIVFAIIIPLFGYEYLRKKGITSNEEKIFVIALQIGMFSILLATIAAFVCF